MTRKNLKRNEKNNNLLCLCVYNLSGCITMNMQVMVTSHGLLLYLIRCYSIKSSWSLYCWKKVPLSLCIKCCINATQIINSEGSRASGFSPRKSKALGAELQFTLLNCFRKYLKQFNPIWRALSYLTSYLENMRMRKNRKRIEQNKIYFVFVDIIYIILDEWRLHANHGRYFLNPVFFH